MSTVAIRSNARLLSRLVLVPFTCFAILAAVLLGNIIWQGGRYADGVAIYYLPMALYMYAIWTVRRALLAVADGALFGGLVPRLLLSVGGALFVGAVFTVFGVPLMTALVWGRPYIATFEPSPIMLGVVGATLMLLSQLFAKASTLQDEIEEFF